MHSPDLEPESTAMDVSLLHSDSSDSDTEKKGAGRWRRKLSSIRHANVFNRTRSTAVTNGDKYERAAAMVDLAEDGIGIPTEVLEQDDFDTAGNRYFLYTKLDFLWTLTLFALVLLNFFEVPLWCKGASPHPCGDKQTYYLGDLPYLSRLDSLIYEAVVLVILAVYTFAPISYVSNKLFWSNPIEAIKAGLFVVLVIDAIVNALYISSSGTVTSLPFRLAPYVRVLIFGLNIRELRQCANVLLGIIPSFLDIFALLIIYIVFSSWVAYILFEDTTQGKTYFTSYWVTLYQMFVLFTTANNPDVWLPAYQASRFSSIFFILYILFGVYFIFNLILAVVYNSFKEQFAQQLVSAERKRVEILSKAFDIIDTKKKGTLDIGQSANLFKQLNKYRTLPNVAEEDMLNVFYALDDSGDFQINKEEFMDLCSAIGLRFEKAPVPSWLESFPVCYNSAIWIQIRHFVKSKNFEYIVQGMLVVNMVTVGIESYLDLLNDTSSQKIWQTVELALGWLYVVEMLLKISVYGFTTYWRDYQNRFDFVITVVVVVAETLTLFNFSIFSNPEWIRYLLIARLLRLTRLLMLSERYRVVVATFLKLIPSLSPYLGVIFCVMCIYCSLGIHLFGGVVNELNPSLKETTMYENDYMVKNFNDFPSGMVLLFDLMILGNWQVWMESYAHMTHWTATFYFLSYYVIAVLFLLNLVVAFVLEAFFAELDMDKATADDDEPEEAALSTHEATRRKARRAKSGSVQALLNQMLSEELEKSKSSGPSEA